MARGRHGRSFGQRGYSLLLLMLVLGIASVWLTNAALTAGYGVLSAAGTRDRLNARIAANERTCGAIPEGTGGSVWPETPVAGYFDYLAPDGESGRLRVVAGAELPKSGQVVLRQWRLSANADGGRLLEVSAVILDAATLRPVAPPAGGEFRRSEIVE